MFGRCGFVKNRGTDFLGKFSATFSETVAAMGDDN
jgi:hypothetical protein